MQEYDGLFPEEIAIFEELKKGKNKEKAMSKPFIPFGWMPGHWGLKGKTRKRAQAEYELKGIDLDRQLVVIDAGGEDELEMMLLEVDLNHSVISRAEYDRKYAENHLDDPDKTREILRLDHAEGKISDNDHAKGTATLNKESWVSIINIKPDSEKPNHGELELDWNELFVEELKEAGYEAAVDEQIVDMWLADLCRNIAMEQFSGTGDFDEKVADQFIKKSPKTDSGTWEAS